MSRLLPNVPKACKIDSLFNVYCDLLRPFKKTEIGRMNLNNHNNGNSPKA